VAALLDITRDELEHKMIEARHTRIPICEASLDHIVGFVSTKEFFLNPDRDIRELLKPVAIFPEGARIHRVFRRMQKNHINMAVIVDEYGVTSGIVTEELIRSLGPDEWFVVCRAPIEQVNEVCGIGLPEGESVTLNGYLCDEFGEIPIPGRTLEQNGVHFTVVESRRRRIVSVRIKRVHRKASENDT
jgi:putative hemolysin